MIQQKIIENVLELALEKGASFGEVYIEREKKTGITMINETLDTVQSGIDFGVGIRIFLDGKSIYGYTNDTSESNLLRITNELILTANLDRIANPKSLTKLDFTIINPILHLPTTIEKQKKVAPLYTMSQAAKAVGPLITQRRASYIDTEKEVLIANTEGVFAEEKRVRTRLSIEAIATNNNEKQTGRKSPGASMGFELMDTLDLEALGKSAGESAKTMVLARPCPKGTLPVVIENGFGGVIFHEACGHGLEATSLVKNASVFCGKMGQQIASPLVTAIDDSTIKNAWGSTAIDDEGAKTKKRVLIENGILSSYLVDKYNGEKMGIASSSSGRRESYRYAPTSRMSNTYIDAGKSKRADLFSGIKEGLYAKDMGGGSVNPATGEFNFVVQEGYWIENGEIKEPVQGATLIGKGAEVLERIDMIADDLAHAQGMCGSVSGSIPTNVGQPPLRVSKMVIGGKG